jgi:hypothetical protein
MKTKKLNLENIRKDDVVVFTDGRNKKLILVTLISKSGRIYGDEISEIQKHPEILNKSPSNRINPYRKLFPEQHRVYPTSLSIQPRWYFRMLMEKENDSLMESGSTKLFIAAVNTENNRRYGLSFQQLVVNYRISVYNTKDIISAMNEVFTKLQKSRYYLHADIRQTFAYSYPKVFDEQECFKHIVEAHKCFIRLTRKGGYHTILITFSNGKHQIGSWSMPLNTNYEKTQCIALLRRHEILPTVKGFNKALLGRY